VVGVAPGANALLINGRLIALDGVGVSAGATFAPESFASDLRLAALFHSVNFPAVGKLAHMLAEEASPASETFMPEVASALAIAAKKTMQASDNIQGNQLVVAQQYNEFLSDVLLRVQVVLLRRTIAAAAAKDNAGGYGGGGGGRDTVIFPSSSAENLSANALRFASPSSPFTVRALVDPLSKTAQKLSAVLLALREQFDADITIWLTPKAGLTEFPLKRFYRYALSGALPSSSSSSSNPSSAAAHLSFDEFGSVRPYAGTTFSLRTRHILSTVLHTPESWGIRLARANPDLDNLNVADLAPEHLEQVQYDLESLLLFGQSLDLQAMEPPAGLQLMMSSHAHPWLGDTVVMQNLGYFQLKAPGPGEWTVAIADARHAEIYELLPEGQQLQLRGSAVAAKGNAAVTASDSAGAKRGTRVLFIRSFNDGFVRVDVRRKPGQERAQLLDPSILSGGGGGARNKAVKAAQKVQGAVAGVWNSVFGGSDSAAAGSADLAATDANAMVSDPVLAPRSGETIHVFSLASGHLYERFLKIMMLSVLSSTRNPVKFWFLANFASPQFRAFVPRMAKELRFEAEFVTYKWPLWLRRQEEKQRIIWGYKILFLDVLFPLAVRRVIYIDADQVVRGDIKELYDMDLQGAPYAYTPFCLPPHNNPATEGFRFWNSGYWKDHLRGKPYHISALYVVDLDTFRAMRAGDALRGIYDQLSADPNSLANLDQDLPNFASHNVPIYSLPQEWLFCETWCSKDFLPKAKTVDLCNNPLTKTPKLEVAKQLLPEWTGLDERAQALGETFAARDAAAAAGAGAGQRA
jgi:UDP-glucose:glycoprotein glucosyltransferase